MKKFYFILICVILISLACIFGPLIIIEGHGGGHGGRGGFGRGWGRGFGYYRGPSYYGNGSSGYNIIPVYYPHPEYYFSYYT
jgi:hypothetical protein